MSLKINRENIPQPGQPRPFHFPEFEIHKLPDESQAIVVHKDHLPLVNVLFHLNLSPLDDQPGKEGQANLLSLLLLEGSKRFTSAQIAQQFETLGAHYNTHLGWTGFYFELNILKDHLQRGLELSSEILHHSVLPEREFNRLKQEALIDRLQIKDMPGRVANEHFLRHLFKGHRYALPIEGLSSSLQKIELQQLKSLYRNTFLMRKPTLIYTGNIQPSEALDLTERYFTRARRTTVAPELELPVNPPEKQNILFIHKPRAAQIEVRVGQFMPPRQHPDFFKLKLMNEILGGYFLSRLNLNLREKHGFTYGIHSNLVYRPGVGLLMISASIQSEFIAPALQEIFKELARLKEKGVTADELRSAAGYLIGVFPTAFETIDQISDAIANIVTYDLPLDYYRTFREKLAGITVEQVNQAAQTHIKPQAMQVVLVGDRDQVGKALKDQFEIQFFDLDGNPLD